MSAPAWACRPKPLLHGLILRKSPIKKPRNIISGQVESSTRLNITTLHKTQQISHLETSSITNISRYPPKNNPSSLQLILLFLS